MAKAKIECQLLQAMDREQFLELLSPEMDLILADYFLPDFSALQALQVVKERGLQIPLIVLSGVLDDEKSAETIKQGAIDLQRKDRLARLGPAYYGVPLIAQGEVRGVLELFHRSPLKPDPDWLEFLESFGLQAAVALENAVLFAELQRSNSELAQAYESTIEGWARALDFRDKETEGPSRRVTDLTIAIANALGICEVNLAQCRL